MTLTKKATRTIRIDDKTYRWTISAADEPGLGLVVEAEQAPAQRVVTWFNHGSIITPAVVRHCILTALEDGWRPHELGPELRYRVQSGATERPVRY